MNIIILIHLHYQISWNKFVLKKAGIICSLTYEGLSSVSENVNIPILSSLVKNWFKKTTSSSNIVGKSMILSFNNPVPTLPSFNLNDTETPS